MKDDTKDNTTPPLPEPVVFPTMPPDVPKPEKEAAARRSVFSVW